MSKKLIAVALMLSFVAIAFAGNIVTEEARSWTAPAAEDGGVSWFSAPKAVPNGWYWMYDTNESGPPFSVMTLAALPGYQNIHTTGSKMAPYNDEPYQYTMPDSFWYYGVWYEPGDKLFISPDGWVSFDNTSEEGYPDPPADDPPFPVNANPNALIAPLWQDHNPTHDPDPSDNNRVYYEYDPTSRTLGIEWYQVEGHASGNIFTFEALLSMGGQDKLLVEGACGIVFSYHFIHFLYSTTSAGWDADNVHLPPAVGIEDYEGNFGVYYDTDVGSSGLANGRCIRMGYKRIFKHDVEAYAFLSPGGMVLRYTPIEPQLVVRNIGEETEHFTVTLDIYNGTEQVYHNVLGAYDLLPGFNDTIVAPCWEPGEIDELYDKVLFTSLERDECKHNDTHIVQSLVHCDDTFRYDWNYGDMWGWGINYGSFRFMAFYGVDGGVLISGGRTWLQNLYGTGYPAIEVLEANGGCGGTSVSNVVTNATCETFQVGWNYAYFGGFGAWANSGTPGNIWAAWTPASTPHGYHSEASMLTWPGPHSCYLGSGPGRGGYLYGSSFYWGGYSGSYYTSVTELFVHLGFGDYPLSPMPAPPCYYEEAHDLTAFRMEEPNIDYVEAGVDITPEIAIANIGRQTEPDGGFFPVKFFAIDTYGKINGVENDTIFADTSLISQIGWMGDATDDPDTLFVPITPWTPEGVCHPIEPFVFYELIGLVRLGEVGPDESDHCPYNDTVRRNVTCLLSHDVGVIDLDWPEEPDELPDIYGPGSTITPVALVENFGYDDEHDVEVRCEVTDVDSGGVELWHSLQNIIFLDWRGNVPGNPFTILVEFPTYNVLTDYHHQIIEARTELVGDLCPDNDEEIRHINSGIVEDIAGLPFTLEVASFTSAPTISFAVPYTVGVSLKVYDISGKLVSTLVSGSQTPGAHSVSWNTAGVAKGIYLVRMDTEGFSATKKVVLW